ncbi:hypothetical protein AAG747_22475 [Rapidithrix thailandica]|uniref:Uncharacterized protein n=1 Tax=Rapidithrix thailandica TaxID=413964 RepID=A0AAW9S9X9_9BACT
MKEEEFIRGIICQVLVKEKSRDLIYSVLNEFIPDYEPLNLDFIGKPNDEAYEFESEDEIISYYTHTKGVRQTFYWNKYENNPNRIMVGANILEDDQIVFSLTVDGTKEKKAEYLKRLKTLLNSETGVISYINPVGYDNGQDFETKYGSIKYKFE